MYKLLARHLEAYLFLKSGSCHAELSATDLLVRVASGFPKCCSQTRTKSFAVARWMRETLIKCNFVPLVAPFVKTVSLGFTPGCLRHSQRLLACLSFVTYELVLRRSRQHFFGSDNRCPDKSFPAKHGYVRLTVAISGSSTSNKGTVTTEHRS
jgi:hypothetical protein